MIEAYKTQTKLAKPSSKMGNARPKEIEDSLERLGWIMDDLFQLPIVGWRIGLDAIVGLIPGVGDTLTSLASFYILAAGVRYGVPKVTLFRMGLNLGIDYVLGSVPIFGDILDAWWKSNQKNLQLLRRRATVSAEEANKGKLSDWLFVSSIIVFLVALVVGTAVLGIYVAATLWGQLQLPFSS